MNSVLPVKSALSFNRYAVLSLVWPGAWRSDHRRTDPNALAFGERREWKIDPLLRWQEQRGSGPVRKFACARDMIGVHVRVQDVLDGPTVLVRNCGV